MKTISLTTLTLLLLTTSVIAQVKTETSDPPDVSVLEKSWSKETRYRDWDQNPNPPASNENLMRQMREEQERIAIFKDSRSKISSTPEVRIPQPNYLAQRYTTYVYKIKAKNNGLKTIKALYWEYQFLDPDTERVLGTHRMVSSQKLSPGKTRVFKAETAQPPVAFVSYNQVDEKFRLKFTERLIIHRIDYTDGTFWERP